MTTSDDLRDRIAAAIMESCHGVYLDDAVNAADAVIRELGLTQEWGALDPDDSGFVACNRDEVEGSGGTVKCRYITPWLVPPQ